MKPITLSPAQLDAALGLPVRPAWCWGDGWCDGAPCTCAHPDQPPAVPTRPETDAELAARYGDAPPNVVRLRRRVPRPRLECTCAGRDYGLCPNCAVGT